MDDLNGLGDESAIIADGAGTGRPDREEATQRWIQTQQSEVRVTTSAGEETGVIHSATGGAASIAAQMAQDTTGLPSGHPFGLGEHETVFGENPVDGEVLSRHPSGTQVGEAPGGLKGDPPGVKTTHQSHVDRNDMRRSSFARGLDEQLAHNASMTGRNGTVPRRRQLAPINDRNDPRYVQSIMNELTRPKDPRRGGGTGGADNFHSPPLQTNDGPSAARTDDSRRQMPRGHGENLGSVPLPPGQPTWQDLFESAFSAMARSQARADPAAAQIDDNIADETPWRCLPPPWNVRPYL